MIIKIFIICTYYNRPKFFVTTLKELIECYNIHNRNYITQELIDFFCTDVNIDYTN